MIRHCRVDQVPHLVQEGTCVIKPKLYEVARLFSDAEVASRKKLKAREEKDWWARLTSEMEAEFRRIDDEKL